jgi:ureidoglycolate lyase
MNTPTATTATAASPSPSAVLAVQALTASAFRPYGDVIEASQAAHGLRINDGTAERFDDLAHLDLGAEGGRPLLSLFRARARALPLHVRVVERHRLGSQAFMPLDREPFLVIVAAAAVGTTPQRQDLQCFLAQPGQGVNFARGTWHHPLVALTGGDFLVIDRGAADGAVDCEELDIAAWGVWVQAAAP